jgi:hypothetical protein
MQKLSHGCEPASLPAFFIGQGGHGHVWFIA